MRGKKARQIRKMLNLNYKELEPTEPLTIGSKEVYVIDSVKDELRIEERPKVQYFSDENKRLYRKLKGEYQNNDSEIGKELRSDLNGNVAE